jgi:hypothetical protein
MTLSRMIRSGLKRFTSSRASAPLSVFSVSKPSFVSITSKNSRLICSSSTRSMRFFVSMVPS